MTLEEMLAMKLNDTKYLNNVNITRVPGGWIYSGDRSAAFVPEPPIPLKDIFIKKGPKPC